MDGTFWKKFYQKSVISILAASVLYKEKKHD